MSLISRVDRDHHDSSDRALIWMIMPSARPSWWHCCLLAYFRVRATNNLFDNGWGSSIVVPSKQNWLAIGWPLLCSCWNFWCQLWRMPASETCKTHPLCPHWTTMFPPPCQQADQAATCTFALPFKFPFLSLSLFLSLVFGTMQFYRTPKNDPPKKRNFPTWTVTTGTSEEYYFFHRHSRWLYIQQQSSSSSSNRFIEHDVSTRKLGSSSGIRPSFLNRSIEQKSINGSV